MDDETKQFLKEMCESANRDWANNTDGTPRDGGPYCEKCRNKRMIHYFDWETGYEWVEYCECYPALKAMRNIRKSGLGEYIKNLTFANFERKAEYQKQMYDLAQEFFHSNGQSWFAIFGQTGAGKTHICTALCGELLNRGQSLIYLRWAVEIKRIKMLGGGSNGYVDEMDKIFAHDVIYIDDLFKCSRGRTPTDAEIDIAFELIDNALSQRKILILSGETTLEQIRDIDEATAGRIKKECGKYLLQIKHDADKNYRLKE